MLFFLLIIQPHLFNFFLSTEPHFSPIVRPPSLLHPSSSIFCALLCPLLFILFPTHLFLILANALSSEQTGKFFRLISPLLSSHCFPLQRAKPVTRSDFAECMGGGAAGNILATVQPATVVIYSNAEDPSTKQPRLRSTPQRDVTKIITTRAQRHDKAATLFLHFKWPVLSHTAS